MYAQLSNSGLRFTLLMERLVIDVLSQFATVSGACRLLGLSWDEAWGVMERAVVRGRRRKQAKVPQHGALQDRYLFHRAS
jgi:transposase